jgi:hypothetical protein
MPKILTPDMRAHLDAETTRLWPPPPLPLLCLWRFSISGRAQITLRARRMDPNTWGMPMP